jgi:hypothetical protein
VQAAAGADRRAAEAEIDACRKRFAESEEHAGGHEATGEPAESGQ